MSAPTEPSRTAPPTTGTSLWTDAVRRLRRNRLAVAGLVVVVLMLAASAIGPWIIATTTGYTYDYIPTNPALHRTGRIVLLDAPHGHRRCGP